jgi:hypothetical protein
LRNALTKITAAPEMILMKLAILGPLFSKLCVIGALAANGTILQSFPGGSGPGYKPAADTTGALLQEGLVDDPNYDYTHPSLAVDAAGNIGIGCTRTSTNEFPSVCIMMKAATDPPGTMRPPMIAVPGTTYFRYAKYKLLPWGNYSATCVDPSDPKRLWTYQEYANSTNDGQWSTAWASFQLDSTR